MTRLFSILTLATLCLCLPAKAQQIETRAKYAIMMDHETGAVLMEKNADELMAPASMSKLMTLAVLFQRIKDGTLTLDDTFPVSEKAWKKGGSKMWVMVKTEVRIEDLIRGIIVQSGNDACIVVAEGISGTEEAFADEMIRFAREIGMEQSTFANSTGWPDPNQRMTARELAILTRHIITEYPELYKYFAEKEFTWSDINQPNRNPLLYANVGADGLKTGHTEESGYGLTASAVGEDRRIILVVNGLSSESERSTESQRLMRVGFRDFRLFELFQAGDTVGTAQVWQGEKDQVKLRVDNEVKLFLRPQDRKRMKVTINYPQAVRTPIKRGDEIAEMRVILPTGATLVEPLHAAENVGPMGVFGKMGIGLSQFLFGSGSEPDPEPAPETN